MTKLRKIGNTTADPSLPKTPIAIDGKEWNLCFDYSALAEAEQALNQEGHAVNLLLSLPVPSLATVKPLFAAALRTFHPEVSFEEASAMVTLANARFVADLVCNAWMAAQAEPEPDPTQAVAD